MVTGTTVGRDSMTPARAPQGRSTPAQAALAQAIVRLGRGSVRVFEPGETIFSEGAEAATADIVVSGLARCFRMTGDGRRHVSKFVAPQGVLSLGAGATWRCSTEAITRTAVQSCPAAALMGAVLQDAHLAGALRDVIAQELDERERSQLRVARLTAEERVADFLVQWRAVWCESDDGTCAIPMSRLDIADHLGVTLETVSRALNTMHRRGLIHLVDPHHFRIRRTCAMESLAMGDRDMSGLAAA